MTRQTVRALLSGEVENGANLAHFERAISARLGGPTVRAVGSGRLALVLALRALEVHPPATIILPSYNASCVPNILQAAGYRLYFVDINPDSLHLDPKALPSDKPEGAEAIIVTHMEGCPADIGPISSWAKTHGLRVVEDAAHALGATLRKAPVGSFGDAAIFSLGRGKLLNTLGGGLCVVQGPEVAKRLNQEVDRLPATGTRRVLKEVVLEGVIEAGTLPAVFGTLAMPAIRFARRFGKDPMSQLFEDDKDAMTAVPAQLKRRLSNLQASFGCAGLAAFDRGLAKRRENAEHIRAALNGVIPTQRPVEGSDPAWLELTALVDDREAFQRALLALGVDTQRAWMDACDALPAFSSALSPPCPQARRVAASAVYLPTYAALTHAQRDLVVRAVCESLA